MIEKDKFESREFAIQLMARGSFVDNTAGDPSAIVEAFTIRLNGVAMNAWILSYMMNVRECYSTDEEWEAHKAEYAEKRKTWNEQIIEDIGIDPEAGSVTITQSQSEVFTVVHIRKIVYSNSRSH